MRAPIEVKEGKLFAFVSVGPLESEAERITVGNKESAEVCLCPRGRRHRYGEELQAWSEREDELNNGIVEIEPLSLLL